MSTAVLSTHERTTRIRHAIVTAGQRYKARYPVLRHQDAIGATVMLVSVLGMAASGAAWYYGYLSAWASIPLSAFFASLIHELEHDLIHLMYFRMRPLPHNFMMLLCWLTRPLTINPWLRRHTHFNHHKHSGTATDVEERGITNGETWRMRRVLMIFDGQFSIAARIADASDADARRRILKRGALAYFPVGTAAWLAWYAFVGFHVADGLARMLGSPIDWSSGVLAAARTIDVVTVVLLAPNLLRSFCINLVSSNMHYYGDVEDGNVIQQTQVLTPWWMTPFQLFSFNFGATHAIHHFVVGQPFYLRQMVASAAYPVMRQMGVRFNDTGTFGRANRWNEPAPISKVEEAT